MIVMKSTSLPKCNFAELVPGDVFLNAEEVMCIKMGKRDNSPFNLVTLSCGTQMVYEDISQVTRIKVGTELEVV